MTKAKHLNIEEILELNPHIDREKLEKASDLLLRLRSIKKGRSGYGLAPPFARRRISVRPLDDMDSRTVHIRRRV
jgi:hypothetical protein